MTSLAAEQQNVLLRVANLPLVSSACDMASSAYISAKENHPYLKSACEVAEKGVKSIAAVALASAKPLIQKLEPQIALTNSYACIVLDKIEEKLPIYQPTDKIVAKATDMVVSAIEAVAGTVTGAKDTVTGVKDMTKGAVQGSMEVTKAAVSGSMNTVLGSRMVQIVSTGVDTALTKSEALVDQYLPLIEAKEVTRTEGFEAGTQKPSFYIRLGSLSSKIHRHAYEQAWTRVKEAKHKSQEAIPKPNHAIDLMEYSQKNLSIANQKLYDAQERLYRSLGSWKRNTEQDEERVFSREHIESCAWAMAQDLSCQLQTNCLVLIANIQSLPYNIQHQAYYINHMAGHIYQNFHAVSSFRDVSDQLLATSKDHLNTMKETLDEVMGDLANNKQIKWLICPVCSELQHEGKVQTC